ncbi:hypothetical protein KCP71_24975 [Salmonella enterica subsp. enterica]|nr:hypothetical protein KCP71_24975 [Salmonella enterica subsp. enterica]
MTVKRRRYRGNTRSIAQRWLPRLNAAQRRIPSGTLTGDNPTTANAIAKEGHWMKWIGGRSSDGKSRCD